MASPARSRAEALRDFGLRAADMAGERVPGASAVIESLERERAAGSGLLAGRVAYRLFILLVRMSARPHRDAPWQALLPGVFVVAIGTQLMHVVVALYLAPKLTSSPTLYGALALRPSCCSGSTSSLD